MIKADDLIHWIRSHATGCSITVPNGWIRGSDLSEIAQEVLEKEPFDCLLPVEREQ